jgi:hypothetical protein
MAVSAHCNSWFVNLRDDHFDICCADDLDQYYERQLDSLNITHVDDATPDQLLQLDDLRKTKLQRMTLTWDPDLKKMHGWPLNVTVYQGIMKRAQSFDWELGKRMQKLAKKHSLKGLLNLPGDPYPWEDGFVVGLPFFPRMLSHIIGAAGRMRAIVRGTREPTR